MFELYILDIVVMTAYIHCKRMYNYS